MFHCIAIPLRNTTLRHTRCNIQSSIHYVYKSSLAIDTDSDGEDEQELGRLTQIRNTGIFAHIDAGKTTVTERCLALAGVVRRAGSVDDGNTVTDYLPAERERGITISSAAISFPWRSAAGKPVTISLIDTPGHIDFSVEVNRSVAVLDGAVLVIDSVAGVQAQTETVWKAMDELPCLALVNKMDKDGCNFETAMASLKRKLPGANPIPIQLPLFRSSSSPGLDGIKAVQGDGRGDFCGVVDLVHMRAIVWPETTSIAHVESCVPEVYSLADRPPDCAVLQAANESRDELIESMAEVDESIEEFYLVEQDPSVEDIQAALRRITLNRSGLPVMAAAALRGKGVEPVLDAVAELLPSPLDRPPPKLLNSTEKKQEGAPYGHPLNPTLLALAFKVVHMKGRGGSGDGRVVFARVYSGRLMDRSILHVVSPSDPNPRKERVGGMLELSGGKFSNLEDGECRSGEVCALVGMKSVKTGDTIILAPGSKAAKNDRKREHSCLAGVEAPKPVLKVRLETETRDQQERLTDALGLLAIEDPSLVVEETDSATLLSGLGELHVEVTVDRLQREFGLQVLVGAPSVTYRETITQSLNTQGLCNYDCTIGEKRLQAAVDLSLEPGPMGGSSSCSSLADPLVTVSDEVKLYLNLDTEQCEEELLTKCPAFQALVKGCQGALRRGPLGTHPMANMSCHIRHIDCEGGLVGLQVLPGALRAAVANAISSTLRNGKAACRVLEPTMGIEIYVPADSVGQVLSDLTGSRRGTVDEVTAGDGMRKTMVSGQVPLVSILGYANSLRSLTGGEGNFSAEYKGHSICDHM